VSTALALTSCEAQTIAAEGGQGIQSASGKGKAPGTVNSFKKELKDCEAMVVPVQPNVTDGSNQNAEAGKQLNTGGTRVLPGISCVFEGVEVPVNPLDVAQAQGQAADMPTIPIDGMPAMNLADGQQADSTPESNARMQQTEAGGTVSTPVVTQDQILETVGAYIDQSAKTGQAKPGQGAPQTVTAQTAAPPQEGQTPAAANAAAGTAVTGEADVPGPMPGGESRQADTAQDTAVPVPADVGQDAAKDTVRSTGKTEYAAAVHTGDAADKNGSALKGQGENSRAGRTENVPVQAENAAAKAEDTMDKAEGAPKRESSVKTAPEEPGKSQASAPVTDHRETAPAAKDNPVKAAPQPRAEEAAQYSKENVLRIVDKVSTQSHEGRYDFDVELKPEFLGKVNIKLTMEDGVIRMQIKTDDMSVRGMLTDQASSLQNALKEKGITLSSVDVTYESQASLDDGKQPFERNDGQRRQGSMQYAHADTRGYEPAAEPYSYYVGNSSVEFLA